MNLSVHDPRRLGCVAWTKRPLRPREVTWVTSTSGWPSSTRAHAAVRSGAVRALRYIRPSATEAIPALVARLEDEDRDVRALAARTLATMDARQRPE